MIDRQQESATTGITNHVADIDQMELDPAETVGDNFVQV
jgi:hypothetical protein